MRLSTSSLLFGSLFLFLLSGSLAEVICKVGDVIGCFVDDTNGKRALPFTAVEGTGSMTQEICAQLCYRHNYSIAAVEYAYQCFCGDDFIYKVSAPMSECNTPCTGNNTQKCGGNFRMLAFHNNECRVVPNGHACLDSASRTLPFCNPNLTLHERLNDLIKRLTLDEKLGILGPDTVHTNVDPCSCMTAGIARLGIPSYMQIVETNSAVASACYRPGKCATEFPGPTLLAATFNRSAWQIKGRYLSDEMRAYNNLGWYRAYSPFALIGLLGYGPNMNIVRDPRFGRNSELPSEDPFLSGTYAVNYVTGCQVGEDDRYFKMISGLKHYACYSIEDNRGSRIPNVSTFDLWDTYLPQYQMAFDSKQGNAQAVMCSYAGANGVPSCANDFLLNKVVREKWGRRDVLVGSDCGAISNMVNANHYAKDNTDAAAKALNGGCDVNMGDSFYPPVENGGNGALRDALSSGATDMAHVDVAVTRVLSKRFLTGQFDPIENQLYTKIGPEVINSSAHWDFVLESALQGLVLLKNADKTLPFPPGRKLAVVGPHVFSTRDLFEDYKGDQECFGGGDNCVTTIAEAFTRFHGSENTKVALGVDIDSQDASKIQDALEIVGAADQVVLCLGIGNQQEHEGIDRTNIGLPGLQEKFAQMVLAKGKPVVIVIVSGGIVGIDTLVKPASAIIQAFYPAMRTGEALYLSIFGHANRWGKLPVTIYPADYTQQISMYDFEMTKAPGRTYRYYTGDPLFQFGHGLSYTTFHYNCSSSAAKPTIISCSLSNTGSDKGDEVLQVYHIAGADVKAKVKHPVPIRSLVDFARISLLSGEKTDFRFEIPLEKLSLTNLEGDKVVYSGTHLLAVTNGVSEPSVITVVISPNKEYVVEHAL